MPPRDLNSRVKAHQIKPQSSLITHEHQINRRPRQLSRNRHDRGGHRAQRALGLHKRGSHGPPWSPTVMS